MDRPQPVTPELRADLRNLRSLNRHFGSHALVQKFLGRWIVPGAPGTVLDVATGSGDIPRLIAGHARRVGAPVAITAIDRQSSTLEIARTESAAWPEITFVEADALAWTPVEPYDFVFCSLALHHFSEADAVGLLRRMAGWFRKGLLVADLRRGPLASAGVFLLTHTFYREEMTRVDARLSARRAFSFPELGQLARQAGWREFGHRRFRFARQAIWMEKKNAGSRP